jgi:hypothetical protein
MLRCAVDKYHALCEFYICTYKKCIFFLFLRVERYIKIYRKVYDLGFFTLIINSPELHSDLSNSNKCYGQGSLSNQIGNFHFKYFNSVTSFNKCLQ